MRKRLFTLALAVLLAAGCSKAKPTYEYRTINRDSDARLKTAEGRNQVMDEMVKDGWQLQDPQMARGGSMVWLREKK